MLFIEQQHLCLYAFNEVSCVSGLSIYLSRRPHDGWMDGCEGITEGGRDDAKRLVTFGYFAGQAGGRSLSV